MTRAYFTAATGAILFNESLSENTLPLFFKMKNLYKNNSKPVLIENINLTIWNRKLRFFSMDIRPKISNMGRKMLKLISTSPASRRCCIWFSSFRRLNAERGDWSPGSGFKQSIKDFLCIWYLYSELLYLFLNVLENQNKGVKCFNN